MHVLQSVAWQQVRKLQGHQPIRIGQTLLLVKPTPLLPLGYIPQVELTQLDWPDLLRTAKAERLSHILIDPETTITRADTWSEQLRRLGGQTVPNSGLYYRQTTVVDLGRDEQQLLAAMKKKHRYNLKLSQEKGVSVQITQSEQDLEGAIGLILETGSRQRYHARDAAYYRQIFAVMQRQDSDVEFWIATAYAGTEPVVAWLLYVHQGTIYYPYGGSSDAHREKMPAYSLVWEIIRWGQSRGLERFDLWGVDMQQPDSGFTRFKLGWGGSVVEYLPSFDLVISPFWYRLFRAANAARWGMLRLRKRLG